MIALPRQLVIEKNKRMTEGAWLLFFEWELVDGTVIRLVNNTEDVTWYTGFTTPRSQVIFRGFSFELDWTELDIEGRIPETGLRISNVTLFLEQYLQVPSNIKDSTVKLNYANSLQLDSDHSQLELTYTVQRVISDPMYVTMMLGGPNPLSHPFPSQRYLAVSCRHDYNDVYDQAGPACGYAGKSVEDVTLPSGAAVIVQVTGHNWLNGDVMKFADVVGTTELNGSTYTITKINADTFSLDGTDGDDFTAYVSGGTVGFATCPRNIEGCRKRENETRIGQFIGLRSGTVRIASTL